MAALTIKDLIQALTNLDVDHDTLVVLAHDDDGGASPLHSVDSRAKVEPNGDWNVQIIHPDDVNGFPDGYLQDALVLWPVN